MSEELAARPRPAETYAGDRADVGDMSGFTHHERRLAFPQLAVV
jgi:hypothetical protein